MSDIIIEKDETVAFYKFMLDEHSQIEKIKVFPNNNNFGSSFSLSRDNYKIKYKLLYEKDRIEAIKKSIVNLNLKPIARNDLKEEKCRIIRNIAQVRRERN